VVAAVELISVAFAAAIYGTPARPRHPIYRNSLRTFVFVGGILLLLWMVVPNELTIPFLVAGVWAFCGLTVCCAEYDFGSPKIAIASWSMAAILLTTGLMQGP
jgi:peptidoglycan/LPS O-acetylase OafA/YrhL